MEQSPPPAFSCCSEGLLVLWPPVMMEGQQSGCVKKPSGSADRVSSAWEPELAVRSCEIDLSRGGRRCVVICVVVVCYVCRRGATATGGTPTEMVDPSGWAVVLRPRSAACLPFSISRGERREKTQLRWLNPSLAIKRNIWRGSLCFFMPDTFPDASPKIPKPGIFC